TDLSHTEMFTVATNNGQAYHWRTAALDDLGPKGDWGIDKKHGDRDTLSNLPVPTRASDAQIVHQSFHVEPAADAYWLPAGSKAVHADVSGAYQLPTSTSLFVPDKRPKGVDYTVDSEVRQPGIDQLEAVTMPDLRAQSGDTQLRKNMPQKVRDLADEL